MRAFYTLLLMALTFGCADKKIQEDEKNGSRHDEIQNLIGVPSAEDVFRGVLDSIDTAKVYLRPRVFIVQDDNKSLDMQTTIFYIISQSLDTVFVYGMEDYQWFKVYADTYDIVAVTLRGEGKSCKSEVVLEAGRKGWLNLNIRDYYSLSPFLEVEVIYDSLSIWDVYDYNNY